MPTHKQLEIFNFIAKHLEQKRVSPLLREIAEACNLKSPFMAYHYVSALVTQGYLARRPSEHNGLRIIKYPEGSISPKTDLVKETPEQAERERAAYARGVVEGRKLAFKSPEAQLQFAVNQAYKRGWRAAKRDMPQTLVEAFDRGITFGRDEMKKELTLQEEDAKLPALIPNFGVSFPD